MEDQEFGAEGLRRLKNAVDKTEDLAPLLPLLILLPNLFLVLHVFGRQTPLSERCLEQRDIRALGLLIRNHDTSCPRLEFR